MENVSWREIRLSFTASFASVEWYCLSCRSCTRQLVKHHRPISKARVTHPLPPPAVRYSVAIATAKRPADRPEQMTTRGDWRWQHSTSDDGHFAQRKINSLTSKTRGARTRGSFDVGAIFRGLLEKVIPSREFYKFSTRRKISRDQRQNTPYSRKEISRNIVELIHGEITILDIRYRINTPIVKRSRRYRHGRHSIVSWCWWHSVPCDSYFHGYSWSRSLSKALSLATGFADDSLGWSSISPISRRDWRVDS